jgi:predicted transcriptional regulator
MKEIEKLSNINRLLILRILIKRDKYLSWDELKKSMLQALTGNQYGIQKISNGKLQHYLEDLIKNGFVKKEWRSYGYHSSGYNDYLITDEGRVAFSKMKKLFQELFK